MKDDPRRPNLFIIGAMKSGTSSLHAYLDAHPDIFMSRQKEPGYFLKEFTWGRGEDWYLSLFEGGESCRYRGESSTHYTKLPRFQGAAERLAEHCPDARLIYLMRDPIERIISHYWHMVMSHDEDRPMLEAVRNNPQYLHVSHYSMQLEPWFARFPRERILTMTFEALIAERADLLVWLDLPTIITMRQVIHRTVARRVRRQELWNGNREAPLRTILSDPDHIIRWAWRTRHRLDTAIPALARERPDLPIVRLRPWREVDRWLATLADP